MPWNLHSVLPDAQEVQASLGCPGTGVNRELSAATWLPGDWIPILGKQQVLLTTEPSFQSCNCFCVLFWVTKGTKQQGVTSVCSWQLHTSGVFPVWPFIFCFMYATGSPLVNCITSLTNVSTGCSTDTHFSGWLEIIIIYEQRWWIDGWMGVQYGILTNL